MTPSAGQITYQLLDPADPSSFEQLFAIYEQSLAPREQKPRADLLAAVSRPDYRVLLALHGPTVVGFSMLFIAADRGVSLVEYMAVHPDHRSSGIGGALFRRTVQLAVDASGNLPVLLEVDSDREASADQLLRRRRLHFYRRLGCRGIDGLSYILPLPGDGPPPEMHLLVWHPEPAAPIGRPELRDWLSVVYERVYDCRPDDSRIHEMLQSVADPVAIV